MRGWERWMVRGGVAVFVPLFLVLAVMFARYQLAERQTGPAVDARWRELRAKYETAETNQSARELEAIARELDLDLGSRRFVRGAPQPPIPPVPEAYVFIGKFAESTRYDKDLYQAASGFLQSHRAAVDRLIRHLAEEPVPRWPATLGGFPVAYLPNDHLQAVNDLIEADLIAKEWASDHAGAERALDALWAMRAALALRPDLLGHWDPFTSSVVRLAPWIGRLDPRWRERVKEVAPHQALGDAIDLHGLRQAATLRAAMEQDASGYAKAALRDYAIAMRQTAAEVATHAPCAVDGEALQKRMRWRLGLWNLPGHMDLPGIDGMWEHADSIAVWAEMAAKVLDLKARREAGGGAWPAAVAGVESSVCVGARWSYAVSAKGAMTLTFSRGFLGAPPLTFSEEARRAR
jgi:hypothetical protein